MLSVDTVKAIPVFSQLEMEDRVLYTYINIIILQQKIAYRKYCCKTRLERLSNFQCHIFLWICALRQLSAAMGQTFLNFFPLLRDITNPT
jgi:hypothetical protein